MSAVDFKLLLHEGEGPCASVEHNPRNTTRSAVRSFAVRPIEVKSSVSTWLSDINTICTGYSYAVFE